MSSALSTHPACGCIDVHHHHGTPEFAQLMADPPSDRAFPTNTWRDEEAPAALDEAGVRAEIQSHSKPYHLLTPPRPTHIARGLNPAAARPAHDYPGTFGPCNSRLPP